MNTKIFLIFLFISSSLFAINNVSFINGKKISETLDIKASSKAIIQWKRIFKNPMRMKRYGISTLNKEEQKALLKYLIKNAKDSNQEEGF